MDLNLNDSVFLVTGGTSGLGRALCQQLVKEGASVSFCGRDPERLEETVTELTNLGGAILGTKCDVQEPSELENFFEQSVMRFGRIDGLVNNAGMVAAKAVTETTDDEWQQDLDLKLMAAVRLSRLCIPMLRESGKGSIVNVLAIAAKTPGAHSTPTSVSRAAGMALTKALSKDLGADNIRVNAVLPGIIASGQWTRLASATQTTPEAIYESFVVNNPIALQRVGTEQEFANLVTFLLSSASSYVTGTAINCDGGLSSVV